MEIFTLLCGRAKDGRRGGRKRLSAKYHCVGSWEKDRQQWEHRRALLRERDWLSPATLCQSLLWGSHVRRWNAVIDVTLLHLICPSVANVCDSSQSRGLKVRISVSIVTPSLWVEEEPDTARRSCTDSWEAGLQSETTPTNAGLHVEALRH